MRSVALRYFNVYGPRQDLTSEYSGVIARFMDVAVARKAWAGDGERSQVCELTMPDGPIQVEEPRYVVYGDGRQSRDFVFVADVVAANLLALDACLRRLPTR
jgi:UDP-glucose 4-epimerase